MHRLLLRNKFSETNYNHVLKQNVRNFSVDCCFRGKCSFVRPTREQSRKKSVPGLKNVYGSIIGAMLICLSWQGALLLIIASCGGISADGLLCSGQFSQKPMEKCFLHKLTYKVMVAQVFFLKKIRSKILKEIKHDDLN